MSRSVSIPLRDSVEDDKYLREIHRFSIDVWNVTQNWKTTSLHSITVLERLVNNKLRIIYARNEGESYSGAGETRKFALDSDTRHRLLNDIVRDAEELTELVQKLRGIVDKLRLAKTRVEAWIRLCPSPGSLVANILHTLAEIVPELIDMYDCEVNARLAGLSDIAEFENRDIFSAVILTFKYEPFINDNLLSRLFALVCTEL